MFALFLAGHLVGDWIVQTDWQAANKAWWPGRWTTIGGVRAGRAWRRSVVANQTHCVTYHMTMAAFVLPVWRTWGTVAAFVVSWVSHGFIDRRWPVRAVLRATGSRDFAELPWGVLAADQAMHVAILAVIVAVAGM